jgi:hypothetical protein
MLTSSLLFLIGITASLLILITGTSLFFAKHKLPFTFQFTGLMTYLTALTFAGLPLFIALLVQLNFYMTLLWVLTLFFYTANVIFFSSLLYKRLWRKEKGLFWLTLLVEIIFFSLPALFWYDHETLLLFHFLTNTFFALSVILLLLIVKALLSTHPFEVPLPHWATGILFVSLSVSPFVEQFPVLGLVCRVVGQLSPAMLINILLVFFGMLTVSIMIFWLKMLIVYATPRWFFSFQNLCVLLLSFAPTAVDLLQYDPISLIETIFYTSIAVASLAIIIALKLISKDKAYWLQYVSYFLAISLSSLLIIPISLIFSDYLHNSLYLFITQTLLTTCTLCFLYTMAILSSNITNPDHPNKNPISFFEFDTISIVASVFGILLSLNDPLQSFSTQFIPQAYDTNDVTTAVANATQTRTALEKQQKKEQAKQDRILAKQQRQAAEAAAKAAAQVPAPEPLFQDLN